MGRQVTEVVTGQCTKLIEEMKIFRNSNNEPVPVGLVRYNLLTKCEVMLLKTTGSVEILISAFLPHPRSSSQ